MKILITAIAALAVLGAVGLALTIGNFTAGMADESDPALVARGAAIYMRHCARCHGKNLEGEANWETKLPDGAYPAPPQDGTGHAQDHADRVLFDYTRLGGQALSGRGFKSNMPAFAAKLTDDDIWAVIAFIKSRWPKDVLAEQRRIGAFRR